MKFTKLGVVLAAATFAVGAFADASDVLVSFSTEADYYADGTAVMDGEWYALCWSANPEFGGLTIGCEPVVNGDRVLILAPLAKDGHCPYVFFKLTADNAPAGGNYFVYLLDTRNADGSAVASLTKVAGRNVPSSEVNGSVVAKNYTASASAGVSTSISATENEGAAWVESAVVGEVSTAKITSIEVKNAKVTLTVAGLMPGVKYNVQMGETPSKLTSYALDVPRTVKDDATFEFDPEDAKFFKIIRQPLTTVE